MPATRAWSSAGAEVEPEVKVAAARVVEALGTAPGPGGPRERLRRAGADPALAAQAGALVPPAEPAVVEVVYPQYGGLTVDAASIMLVAEQVWPEGGRLTRRSVTVDVRLSRRNGGWRVTELRPVEPGREGAASGLTAALEDARVVLPDAAAADVAAGLVEPVVVHTLLELSERYELSVSVFRSGHPVNVFGTGRTSNHTRGRAVDIWAIDAVPVVSMAVDDPVLLSFLAAARDAGCDEIGGPVDPDGPGGAHFTDEVHRDHVHLGFGA